jgi:uncharacterized protein (DUF305 family)
MSGTDGVRRARRWRRAAVGALAGGLVLAGCGTDPTPMAEHMSGQMSEHMSDHMSDQASGGTGGGMSGMTAVRDEADYLLTMVAHHREAIVAARSLVRSEHPELRHLGRSIRASQSQQVRMMERWLDRWYRGASPSAPYQPMMSDLTGLSGDELDRTFLAEMVHHHMMAVMMSRQLLRSGLVRHRVVAALAEVVVEDQTTEIVQMREWLEDWD